MQTFVRITFCALALLLSVSSPRAGATAGVINAADLSIEQLANVEVASVYGASKYDQKITQAPASISIITADDIKKFGYRTLAEALRSVRGLYVSDDRNYSYLGMRGFLRPGDYNTRVLLLVDGHRMNDNIYDSVYFARDAIDVDLIERIEVIRGPSSSIYGNNAFFGVVSVITKRGAEFDGAEVSGAIGSFDSYKGRFSYGKKYKNELELMFSGSYYFSEGNQQLYYPEFDQRISTHRYATNNGVAEDWDDESAGQFFSSLRYHDFTLSGFFSYRNKHVPTASFDTIFNDRQEETTDVRSYFDLKYEHGFEEDLSLMGRVYYDWYSYCGTYPFDYATPPDPPFRVLYKDEARGQWVGTEWQLTKKLLDRHTVIAGGEHRENLQQDQESYDEDPYTLYLDDNGTSRNLGLFAQAEVVLCTNLLLNAGIRYDYYFDSFGGTFNPRLALIYNPWAGSAFKAMYGEAFRAPNAYEQHYYRVQPTLPALEPETIRTYELAYEQYFGGHYRAEILAYHYQVENLISQTLVGDDIAFENIDEAKATGIELEFEAKYDCGLLARVSYAWQRAEDDSGQELTSSPQHLARFNLSVPLYKDKVFSSLEVLYQSSALTLSGGRADDFTVLNLNLYSRELVKNLELSGGIYNLLNTKYGYPGAEDHAQDVLYQDGRSFQVKLTYRF